MSYLRSTVMRVTGHVALIMLLCALVSGCTTTPAPEEAVGLKQAKEGGGLWFSSPWALIIRAALWFFAENREFSETHMGTPAMPRYQLMRRLTASFHDAETSPAAQP